MHCRNCGAEVSIKAIACPSCGLAPLSEKKFCQECGATTTANQVICIKCGVQLLTGKAGASTLGMSGINTGSLIDSFGTFRTGTYNIPALIVSLVMLMVLFLPWYSYGSGGFWYYTHSTVNAFRSTYGVLAFLLTAGAVALSFVTYKWTFLVGALCFLFSLLFMVDNPDTGYRGYWYAVHSTPSIGCYLFMILSVLYTVMNIKTFKEN